MRVPFDPRRRAVERLTVGAVVDPFECLNRIADFREVFGEERVGFEFALNLPERSRRERFGRLQENDEPTETVHDGADHFDFAERRLP